MKNNDKYLSVHTLYHHKVRTVQYTHPTQVVFIVVEKNFNILLEFIDNRELFVDKE